MILADHLVERDRSHPCSQRGVGVAALLVAGARGLVITTHAPGRLPTLYTCETSRETLDALLGQLVPGCDDALREQAHGLYALHGGNLREVFFGLYEAYAR